jgi:hypothetical protein
MSRYWVGVASRDHVEKAVQGGFFQAKHGREGPVKRMSKGDYVCSTRRGDAVQAFTAIGEVVDETRLIGVSNPTTSSRSGERSTTGRLTQADIRPLLKRALVVQPLSEA